MYQPFYVLKFTFEIGKVPGDVEIEADTFRLKSWIEQHSNIKEFNFVSN